MKFLVWWIGISRTFFAPVSVFFPVLYIFSEAIAFDSTNLYGGGVAHSAHLAGLSVGIAVGLWDRWATRLKWPFIYSEEVGQTLALKKLPSLEEKAIAAEWLVRHNPENVYARLWVIQAIAASTQELSKPSLAFLYQNMPACAAVHIRRGATETVYEILKNLSLQVDFLQLFHSSGKTTLLTLADYALDKEDLPLALRLFDTFAQKFPTTRLSAAVKKTMGEILKYRDSEASLREFLPAYVQQFPETQIPLNLKSEPGRPLNESQAA